MTTLSTFRARPCDHALVVDSWLESYAHGRSGLWGPRKEVTGQRVKDGHRPIVERLLERAEVLVLCDAEDRSVVLGWLCFEGPILHYAYVKKKHRRKGVASALMKTAAELAGEPLRSASHATHLGRKYLIDKFGLHQAWGHAFYPPTESHERRDQDAAG